MKDNRTPKPNMTKKTKMLLTAALLIAALMILTSCDNGGTRNEPIRQTEFLLDTVCTVTVFSKDDEDYAAEALALCADYEQLLSRTVATSEISAINDAGGVQTAVSKDTAELLKKALYYGEQSEGMFDVTIGGVSALWDFSSDSPDRVVPSRTTVETALTAVDYTGIDLSGTDVRLRNPATQLDLGGIAKGFIADKMAEYLTEKGVRAALIDLGGNIVTVGAKEGDVPWVVGVKNPLPATEDGQTSAILGTIEVEGTKSVGTSGTYERFFIQDGVRYHHILDPQTGFPAQTDLAGVTVVTEKSVDGEGITTMCILFGSEKARQYLEENNIPAVLVKDDGTVITTGGVKYAPAA
jgi:thiamine biosynthesis lipoprotein